MDRAAPQQGPTRGGIAALLVSSAVIAGCGGNDGATAREPEQRLAVQRALEKGLDRAPQVVRALEAARREILARAYLNHLGGAHARLTDEEVRRYYTEHPELFRERRIYTLEEIALAARPGIAVALKERAALGQSFDEIAGWLESSAVRYALNRGRRAAEQLPLEVLPRLHAMRDGDVQVLESGDSVVLIRVLASRVAPLDEAAAAPLIREFLRKRRAREAIAAEMKQLGQ